MNFRQQLASLQIGLREHSSGNPRYFINMINRRLRHGLHLDHFWPGGWSPRPDLGVSIIPTYRCNLGCEMCFQRDDSGNVRGVTKDKELSPDQWKLVIDRVARFASTILWMGGEIFIYPRMIELLAYAKAKGLKVLIVTNGFFLADIAEQLVEMNLDAVTVSISGFEVLHNTICHNPQAFARAVQGIKALLSARQAQRSQLPILTINHVMMQQNYRQIPEFVAFARELGVDIVQFLGLVYLNPTTAQRHKETLSQEFGVTTTPMNALDNSRYASGLDATWLQEQTNALLDDSPSFPALRFCSKGLERHIEAHYGPDEHLPLPYQRCLSPWRKMTIQPNGDVTACCKLTELYMGNALYEDLDSIWNREAFRQFRRWIKRQPLPGCIRCGWLDYQ